MKKSLLILAVCSMLTLGSCSTSYDHETAVQLYEKCKSGSYSESDAEKLLKQYEAAWKEIIRLEKEVDNGDETARLTLNDLLYAVNKYESVLRFDVNRDYPGFEDKVHETWMTKIKPLRDQE